MFGKSSKMFGGILFARFALVGRRAINDWMNWLPDGLAASLFEGGRSIHTSVGGGRSHMGDYRRGGSGETTPLEHDLASVADSLEAILHANRVRDPHRTQGFVDADRYIEEEDEAQPQVQEAAYAPGYAPGEPGYEEAVRATDEGFNPALYAMYPGEAVRVQAAVESVAAEPAADSRSQAEIYEGLLRQRREQLERDYAPEERTEAEKVEEILRQRREQLRQEGEEAKKEAIKKMFKAVGVDWGADLSEENPNPDLSGKNPAFDDEE